MEWCAVYRLFDMCDRESHNRMPFIDSKQQEALTCGTYKLCKKMWFLYIHAVTETIRWYGAVVLCNLGHRALKFIAACWRETGRTGCLTSCAFVQLCCALHPPLSCFIPWQCACAPQRRCWGNLQNDFRVVCVPSVNKHNYAHAEWIWYATEWFHGIVVH